MDNLRKNQYVLDYAGLISIGLFSLGYIVFVRPFAELNIQLPFLDFPIFIGEMLLILCLCLFLFKGDLQLKKKHFWIIGYFVFVVVKALYGYSKFGPLAFRHAALFYYPAFIIFAYSFYRRDFFEYKRTLLILAVIITLFVSQKFEGYWLLTCFSLALILSYTYPIKKIGYLLLGALFLTVPYKIFFATSRMMMVANFVAVVYLIIGLYFILRIKKTTKIVIAVLVLLTMAWMLFLFSDRHALIAIVRGDKIMETFKQRDWEFRAIQAKIIPPVPGTYLADDYEPNEITEPQIYNSDVTAKYMNLNKAKMPTVVEKVKDKETGNTQMNNADSNRSNLIKEEYGVNLKAPHFNRKVKEKAGKASVQRDIKVAYENASFRLFIWRDMLTDLFREKPIFGFDFGKPIRSITLETLRWGEGDWKRDGWIGAHNSFLHVIYRAGIIGLLAIGTVFVMLFEMVRKSIHCKSIAGILLCGIIINWFVAANFLLILELPYTAIPIWALFGLIYAYVEKMKPAIQK